MTIDELQSRAMQLSVVEREMLAVNLLSSLAPDDQRDIEEAWNLEILARSDALHAGTAITIDARESLSDIRQSLCLRTPT